MRGQVLIETILAIALIVAITFLSCVVWISTKRDLHFKNSIKQNSKFENELESTSTRLLRGFRTIEIENKTYLSFEKEGVSLCLKNCGKIYGDWIKKK